MKIRTGLFILLVISSTSQLFSQNTISNKERELEQLISDYASQFPGMSVTMIKGDSILFQREYGFSAKNIRVVPDTKFNIYSTSKFITGIAFLKLIHDGVITLDQSLDTIDNELPATLKPITVGQLLSHTSGIRHYKGKRDWFRFASLNTGKPSEALEYFISDPLVFEPGTDSEYTTYGFVLASHILEKITGKDFEDAINDILPFSSRLELDSTEAKKAHNYIKLLWMKRVHNDINARSKFGGGGFIASSFELAEAGSMLFDNKIMELDSVKELYRMQWDGSENGFAFGSFAGISNESFGQPDVLYMNIGGGAPGGRSYLIVVPDLKISVALAGNYKADGETAYNVLMDAVQLLID